MDHFNSTRGIKILGGILIIYAVLVGTHEGEFWPFSIYPMFSKAGNPWTRAMVIDVTGLPEEEIWQVSSRPEQYGRPVALREIGVDQIDYSNFITKTENWTETRKSALHSMLGGENIGNRKWMTVKVRGHLAGEDSVSVKVQPFLLVTADSVHTNPRLEPSRYLDSE